jgi:hypothetical protein
VASPDSFGVLHRPIIEKVLVCDDNNFSAVVCQFRLSREVQELSDKRRHSMKLKFALAVLSGDSVGQPAAIGLSNRPADNPGTNTSQDQRACRSPSTTRTLAWSEMSGRSAFERPQTGVHGRSCTNQPGGAPSFDESRQFSTPEQNYEYDLNPQKRSTNTSARDVTRMLNENNTIVNCEAQFEQQQWASRGNSNKDCDWHAR